MIGTILRMEWTCLCRDRVAQLLTFALPIGFFSIFALIFGNQGGSGAMPRIRLAVVDEDRSEMSRRLVAGLAREAGLMVRTNAPAEPSHESAAARPLTRAQAETLVRSGDLPVALVIPEGFGLVFPNFAGGGPPLLLLADRSNPVGSQMVGGLLQKVAMTSAPDVLAEKGFEQFKRFGGAFTPEQERAIEAWLPMLRSVAGLQAAAETNALAGQATNTNNGGNGFGGFISVKTVDLLGEKKKNPVIAFYAAGIGVMFLLFSCAGAGGSLLEEVESGTLERLLGSRIGMAGLLAGKWLFLTLLGLAQLSVMFLWGALVFKLELFSHWAGFLIMTTATAGAAAAFGLVLAAACRSRAQLSGVSTLVILGMSALGGSMIPRFLMPESLQKIGLITFNGWALDGYLKVFWREEPLWNLWPQVVVLSGAALAFLLLSRMLAKRWETI